MCIRDSTNAYKAMQADKFPNISFVATSVNLGKGNMTGKLTVTNVTKTVTFPVTVAKTGNSYTITGTETIKMTDYGVTPPSFMMNTVKTCLLYTSRCVYETGSCTNDSVW